jgi:hypothetical protein
VSRSGSGKQQQPWTVAAAAINAAREVLLATQAQWLGCISTLAHIRPRQANGAELTLTSALLPRWRRAAAPGHADDDVAAIYTTP